jgi:hypothetical protein
MPRYKVLVDDNFHYQDADERGDAGTYDSLEQALAACRAIVDRSLAHEHRPGISAQDLYDRYTSFGEDPYIQAIDGADAGATFSAWAYAKERCSALCGGS